MRTYTPAQQQQPQITISPRGDGVRIYATVMPTAEKVRLLKLALDYLESKPTEKDVLHG